MIGLGIAIVLPLLLGFFTLRITTKEDLKPLDCLLLSLPVGFGLVSMQMFWLGLALVPLSAIKIVVVVEIAILTFYCYRLGLLQFAIPQALNVSFKQSKITLLCALRIALTIYLISKLALLLLHSSLRPIWAWDSWAIWSATAKAFYFTDSLMLEGGNFFGSNIVKRALSYPLHNPLLQVWFAQCIGSFDESLVKFFNSVLLVNLTAVVYVFGKELLNSLAGLIACVILLSSPLMLYHSIEAYADITLSVYIALSLYCFYKAMQGAVIYITVAGILSAIALFTKEEALFFVLPLTASVMIFYKDNLRLLKPFVVSFLYILAWYVFRFYVDLPIGRDAVGCVLTFEPDALLLVIKQVLSLSSFGVVFLFFPLSLILNGKPSKEFLHLLIPLVCYAGFFIALYMFLACYYNTLKQGTVFFRNMLTYYPSVIMLMLICVSGWFKKHISIRLTSDIYPPR